MAGPVSKVSNPLAAVRSANLEAHEIEEIKESRVQEDSLTETEEESEQEDFDTMYKREAAKYRSAAAKREFFSGMRF